MACGCARRARKLLRLLGWNYINDVWYSPFGKSFTASEIAHHHFYIACYALIRFLAWRPPRKSTKPIGTHFKKELRGESWVVTAIPIYKEPRRNNGNT